MKKNSSEKKQEKKSIGGLLEKIERIEKKLDLMNIMGKTMPVVIICAGSILGSLVYLSSVSYYPEGNIELPQTGEGTTTENFTILYPEYYSEITLPDDIYGLSTEGFLPNTEKVIFYAQKLSSDPFEIGIGEKTTETGQYMVSWQNSEPGTYYLWAEIESIDGSKKITSPITVYIK